MNRTEFMKQLEALLSEISEKERDEAIQYYNDYFDDAGEENETQVISALGSPSKVAETIKNDLLGRNTEEWEFTEAGCTNTGDRKKAVITNSMPYDQSGGYGKNPNGYGQTASATNQKKDSGKIILIVLLLFLTSPVWLSIVGTIIGLLMAILGVLAALLLSAAILAVALIASGTVVFFMAIAKVIISPIMGVVAMGIALVLLGSGIFFMMITVWIVGRVLPTCFRGFIHICRIPFKKRGGQMA